jgi:hypothetical protein
MHCKQFWFKYSQKRFILVLFPNINYIFSIRTIIFSLELWYFVKKSSNRCNYQERIMKLHYCRNLREEIYISSKSNWADEFSRCTVKYTTMKSKNLVWKHLLLIFKYLVLRISYQCPILYLSFILTTPKFTVCGKKLEDVSKGCNREHSELETCITWSCWIRVTNSLCLARMSVSCFLTAACSSGLT